MKDKNAEKEYIEVIVKHDDFGALKSVCGDVQILTAAVVKHVAYDIVGITLKGAEND